MQGKGKRKNKMYKGPEVRMFEENVQERARTWGAG